MKTRIGLAAVLALLASLSVQTFAAVIPVTELNTTPNAWGGYETTCTNGWSINAYHLGFAKICPWGSATWDSETLSPNGKPFLSGNGSFCAELDWKKGQGPIVNNDYNPSTVWLGLDQHKGQPIAGKTLGSINALSYYSYVPYIPQRVDGSLSVYSKEVEYWSNDGIWRWPQQPITLELTVESPDGTQRRQLWYRPWGYNFVGDDYPRQHFNKWEYLNCLTYGKWYIPQCGDISVEPNKGEYGIYDWVTLMSTKLSDLFPDTPEMPTFSQWKLVATSNDPYPAGWKSPGYTDDTRTPNIPIGHPNCTGTGKPINLHTGARVSVFYDVSLFMQGVFEIGAYWINHSYGFRGHVDHFTLGFTGGTSILYNFEPLLTDSYPGILATALKGTASYSGTDLTTSLIMQSKYMQKKKLFKISGKVTRQSRRNSQGNKNWYVIEDGSGLTYQERLNDQPAMTLAAPVWWFLPFTLPSEQQPDLRVGDYASITGFVENISFTHNSAPLCIWAAPRLMDNYSY